MLKHPTDINVFWTYRRHTGDVFPKFGLYRLDVLAVKKRSVLHLIYAILYHIIMKLGHNIWLYKI